VQQAAILRLLGRINVAQGNFDTAAEQLEQSLLLETGPERILIYYQSKNSDQTESEQIKFKPFY